MPDDTWDNIKDLIEAEAQDFLDEFNADTQPEAKKSVRNIGYLSAALLTSPRPENIKLGIDAELSRLASLASIEVSEAQIRTKQITAKVFSLLLDKALG